MADPDRSATANVFGSIAILSPCLHYVILRPIITDSKKPCTLNEHTRPLILHCYESSKRFGFLLNNGI